MDASDLSPVQVVQAEPKKKKEKQQQRQQQPQQQQQQQQRPFFFNKPKARNSHNSGNNNGYTELNAQQEAIVRYVHEKWSAVQKENDIPVYEDEEPNPNLRDFEPFDLEGWWGKKLYQSLTNQTV